MIIRLHQVGKRYGRDWAIRNADLTLESAESYAILGPNGSGKSTLLRLIAGHIIPSAGEIVYQKEENNLIKNDAFFSYFSIVAPYMELIEEFTLDEHIRFHFRFKKLLQGITHSQVADIALLNGHESKLVGEFSSGMKQRLKLTLCLLSDVPVLLLDEPTTNLDEEGVQWYHDMIRRYKGGRLLVIASNLFREYEFCTAQVDVGKFNRAPGVQSEQL